MAASEKTDQTHDSAPERRDRKFAVSANRGRASHKVRYVEAGGATVDTEDCTFCQSVPEPSGGQEKGKPESKD
ncbi:hypothetical protein [Marinobacter salicampi]|uniref:hypothetical protein n=1 Tax=Marinobacter salicampi TaxID=435907 RepID=UPI00140C11EC|nr:hypothetical protein [Marinobacter salicampi]